MSSFNANKNKTMSGPSSNSLNESVNENRFHTLSKQTNSASPAIEEIRSHLENERSQSIESVTDQINEVELGVVSQERNEKPESSKDDIDKRIRKFTSRLYNS